MNIEASPAGKGTFRDYVAIARVDHWFKNIFVLPGAALAAVLGDFGETSDLAVNLLIALLATSLLASANYTINEWLDAAFDRFHPTKKARPAAAHRIAAPLVYLQWVLLSAAGMGLAATLGLRFFVFAAALLVMGIVYNVPPFRTKDMAYLDVLTESVNNPLRFMLGWTAIVSDVLPPSSVLIAYWMGGAYLMAVKRYAEYRFIDAPERAGLSRRSFLHYSEVTLLLTAFFFALSATFFLGVFLIKYRIEFLILAPFIVILFVWYLKIGMQADSVTQRPEKLYTHWRFTSFVVLTCGVAAVLFVVDLPWLTVLVEHHVLSRP